MGYVGRSLGIWPQDPYTWLRCCSYFKASQPLHLDSNDQVMTCTGTGGRKQVLITGTPGTGKTHWQLHLLWRLAQRGATVVLDWSQSNKRYLCTRWDPA